MTASKETPSTRKAHAHAYAEQGASRPMLIRYIPGGTGPGQRLRRAARAVLYLPARLRMALDPEYPWLVHGAVVWLRERLAPHMRGFEYGSGRSTFFFSRRVKSLVSLEHHPKWRRSVQSLLARRDAANVDYRFIPPESDGPGGLAGSRPEIWDRMELCPRKPEFTAYFDCILAFPDQHFDFVCIDGRARVECALNAFCKVKPGGFLLLDNSEWEKYRPIFQAVPDWERLDFENGVWRTSILKKPASPDDAAFRA